LGWIIPEFFLKLYIKCLFGDNQPNLPEVHNLREVGNRLFDFLLTYYIIFAVNQFGTTTNEEAAL
jgi:hypothetical protein